MTIGTTVISGLEQYRRDHGAPPEKLDDLVPNYLSKIQPPTAGTMQWKYYINPNRRDYRLSCQTPASYPSINYDSASPDVGWYVDQ
jgi:hypothetical protein